MKRVKPLTHYEHMKALVHWLRKEGIPFYGIPNGAELTGGAVQAKMLKREGLEPGIPDLCIPVPGIKRDAVRDLLGSNPAENDLRRLRACLVAGMYQEMKLQDTNDKPTAEQRQWGEQLTSLGYRWRWCNGWKEGREQILRYFDQYEVWHR